MSAMIPAHWRGETTDFTTCRLSQAAVQALASHDARPRIDSAIEIIRQKLRTDYIAEILRLTAELTVPLTT